MELTETGIPEKRYFRIGEVSAIAGVEPYVLRYWETEFPKIKPARSRSGQRLYRRRDVELILTVKDLLYKKRYTIAGAKKHLQEEGKTPVSPSPSGKSSSITLEDIRAELTAIRDLLLKE